MSDGLRSVVMTSAGVGMMFFMSPQLAMVGLGIVPPVALWAVVMGRKVKVLSKQVQVCKSDRVVGLICYTRLSWNGVSQDSLADATQLAEERISNVRTVNAFAKQEQEVEAFNSKMDKVLGISAREALVHAKFYGMVSCADFSEAVKNCLHTATSNCRPASAAT